MTRRILPIFLVLGSVACLCAQQPPPIRGTINQSGQKPSIAIPDFRGSGAAGSFMAVFNETVEKDIESSGALTFVGKSMYPIQVPQQPSDLISGPPTPQGRGINGMRLADWSNPPVAANYVGIGYAAEQNSQFVLFGWLFDTSQANNLQGAQALGKIYTGTLNQDGAVQVAHQYAADILAIFGVKSLIGARIVFVSSRTGAKEILDHELEWIQSARPHSLWNHQFVPIGFPRWLESGLHVLAARIAPDYSVFSRIRPATAVL